MHLKLNGSFSLWLLRRLWDGLPLVNATERTPVLYVFSAKMQQPGSSDMYSSPPFGMPPQGYVTSSFHRNEGHTSIPGLYRINQEVTRFAATALTEHLRSSHLIFEIKD